MHRADAADERARARASSPRIVGGDVRMFDVPYWQGPAELVHLLSVISPVADDLAVVFMPLLPVGLWELLGELGIELIEVPEEEYPTLGCNVLAVSPGSSSWPTATRAPRPRWPRPAARSTPTRRPRSGSTARAVRPA